MSQTIGAVYERGVFRPLEPVELPEGERVELAISPAGGYLTPAEMEALAGRVYEGLSEEEIDEIEAMALDRGRFIGPGTALRRSYGMARRMKPSKSGTVKAMSPCAGL
jgi:predicted DNA-binding antitoxin AbrB/MazE fold protein